MRNINKSSCRNTKTEILKKSWDISGKNLLGEALEKLPNRSQVKFQEKPQPSTNLPVEIISEIFWRNYRRNFAKIPWSRYAVIQGSKQHVQGKSLDETLVEILGKTPVESFVQIRGNTSGKIPTETLKCIIQSNPEWKEQSWMKIWNKSLVKLLEKSRKNL